ncbi:hypothetical protein AB5J72_48620 [Streptomyces sp. CG1]|uniref:hypothetical protein n=1 Tax=Streptomyces sp. CG1 TaxID=1287523 RepID=UPI0034E1B9A4
MPAPAEELTGFSSAGCSWSRKAANISLFRCGDWGSRVVSVQIMDGIVDGAHDCGIDGIWTFVDERYITAEAHQFLPSRAGKIELVVLRAKNSSVARNL